MGIDDLNTRTMSTEYLFEDPEKVVTQKQYVPFQELQDVETLRRKILKRTELPFWRILGYFEGTCLRAMMVDWLLWVTIAVFVILRIILRFQGSNEAYRYIYGNMMMDLGDTDVSVIGGFLSFFLVLFVNQSNLRFHEMYKTSQKCPARIFDVAQIMAPACRKSNKMEVATRLIRYLNAAHVAGYVGLSRTYSKPEFFDKLNNLHRFMSHSELQRIQELDMDHGPAAFHELVTWAMMEIENAFEDKVIDSREKCALKEKAAQFREAMDDLYSYCDQPIHFFYIHFLCLLSAVYLPLCAADAAFNSGAGYSGSSTRWSLDVLAGLVVLVQALFVIGLRLLGQVRTTDMECEWVPTLCKRWPKQLT
jgi:Bestrophin, RFP-TM, chloride channel